MGWDFLKKLAGGAEKAVAATQLVTTLFPEKTKKAQRILDKTEEVAETAAETIGQIFGGQEELPGTNKTVLSVAWVKQMAELNGLSLSDEEALKIYNYLRRNLLDALQMALGSISNGRK